MANEFDRETLLEAFVFLNDLRESGRVNMFYGAKIMEDELFYDNLKARKLFLIWTNEFDGSSSDELVDRYLTKEGS